MIAKQIKGRSFRRVLNYLDGKVGAQRIGGNMVGKTPPQLTAEFACSQRLNPTLGRVVYHVSLALPREEAQSSHTWNAIAKDYLKGMGFQGCQHVVYRHTDTEHDHIHIVASRTRLTDGSTVSDSWDYKRSEALVRQLEQSYSLSLVERKDQGVRSQTTGEFRQLRLTGEPSIREKLKPILRSASADSPTMPEFVKRVFAAGVEVRVSPGKHKIRGISYALEGIAFSGTHIGRDYTFPGLQKHRDIAYDSARDDQAIARFIEPNPHLIQKEDLSELPAVVSDRTLEAPQLSKASQITISSNLSSSVNLADSTAITQPLTETEIAFNPYRSEEEDRRAEIDPLQKRCAEAIAPVAIAFLKLMQQNGELEQIGSERWQYQGDRYVMTYDKAGDSFSLEALDGRGELLRLEQGQDTDVISVTQGIGKADIDSFYQMEQLLHLQAKEQSRKTASDLFLG